MISDEAVESAYRAHLEHKSVRSPGDSKNAMREALEAASPYLFAPLLVLADERDQTPGAIRGHVTTHELRQAIK